MRFDTLGFHLCCFSNFSTLLLRLLVLPRQRHYGQRKRRRGRRLRRRRQRRNFFLSSFSRFLSFAHSNIGAHTSARKHMDAITYAQSFTCAQRVRFSILEFLDFYFLEFHNSLV